MNAPFSGKSLNRIPLICFASLQLFIPGSALKGEEPQLGPSAERVLGRFCFECHSDQGAEANINIEQMVSAQSLGDHFKSWQKVVKVLHQKKMPPEDADRPSDAQREMLVNTIRDRLQRMAQQQAGDPGDVVMRRLTKAEYGYVVQDLTGVQIDLETELPEDAVGGEGFTNIGVVQFTQDSTLERYLAAARKVAEHAVIGAGPIQFYIDPGKTGFELSAIHRIQAIYRKHGFRIAAGEGGEAYGLQRYPKSFYACWRFQHRKQLGLPDKTIDFFAQEEGQDFRFVQHLWRVLADQDPPFPISEIVAHWRQLPQPSGTDYDVAKIRNACDQFYQFLNEWQNRLVHTAKHFEEAPVLTESFLEVTEEELANANIDWPNEFTFDVKKQNIELFARLLPQVSHREPAPSDRDPIPAPFDNAYNKPERNDFHYKVKYQRDDRFLVEHILDDATRRRLEEAWADLLMSFEYYDVLLSFIRGKFDLNIKAEKVTALDPGSIDQLPEQPRGHVKRLFLEHESNRVALLNAQRDHLRDIQRFASRAWRRPLTEAEKSGLDAFYVSIRRELGLDHRQAMRTLLTRVLTAPGFLYRIERAAQQDDVIPLDSWEIANRLSFFLWSSVPDAQLRRAAEKDELTDPTTLLQHTKRMLSDAKARRLATEFFGQWFGFYRFDKFAGVDSERFPEFTDALRAGLYNESISFFEHLVRSNRPVREILFADYAFLNSQLARHYQVHTEQELGSELTRVENVRPFFRGGVLGMGSILAVTSAPLRTSPVKRGDWVLRRILGTAVPPPPADAGSIPADDVLDDGLTVAKRLEAHRRNATCANCHDRIDPLGFALESFDAIGRRRQNYRDGQPIGFSGKLPEGTRISDLDDLRDYLAQNEKRFYENFSIKLIGYALGRTHAIADLELIDQIVTKMQNGGEFATAIEQIVTSRQFRYHRVRTKQSQTPNKKVDDG